MYRERSTNQFRFHMEPGVSPALPKDSEGKDSPV